LICVTGSGGESTYSGKCAGINHLTWFDIHNMMDVLNTNNLATFFARIWCVGYELQVKICYYMCIVKASKF